MFAIGGNHNPEESNLIEAKLLNYIEVNGDDPQVNDCLRILKIFREESEFNDYEGSCAIASPIFERLNSADKWDFYDIRILSATVDYAGTFEQVYQLAEKALNELEKYPHEECYTVVKLSIRMNTIVRLLKTKYFDMDDLAPSDELENVFSIYANAVIDIIEKGKFPIHKGALLIRKGLFYQDNQLINKGFALLEEIGASEVYRMMEADASEYNFFLGIKMSKRQFNKIVGENIRKKRISLRMTLEDLAKALDVTTAAVGLVERGERGATSYNLYKLSNLFDMPVDAFYHSIDVASPSIPERRKAQFQKLDALAANLTESELDYLIIMAKRLPNLNRQKILRRPS